MYSQNTFHLTLHPYGVDNSDLYRLTRSRNKLIKRLSITLANVSQTGDNIIAWNLLPYKIRLLPQRVFHYATSTLAGRTCAHIGQELSDCKHLEVLNIRTPQDWFSSRDNYFIKHFIHGIHHCLHQLLQNPKGEIIWRTDYPAYRASWVTRYRSNPWLASKLSSGIFEDVFDPEGLVTEKIRWMGLMRRSGWWQASLGAWGFYQIRGRFQYDPKTAWKLTKTDIWVSEARAEGTGGNILGAANLKQV